MPAILSLLLSVPLLVAADGALSPLPETISNPSMHPVAISAQAKADMVRDSARMVRATRETYAIATSVFIVSGSLLAEMGRLPGVGDILGDTTLASWGRALSVVPQRMLIEGSYQIDKTNLILSRDLHLRSDAGTILANAALEGLATLVHAATDPNLLDHAFESLEARALTGVQP